MSISSISKFLRLLLVLALTLCLVEGSFSAQAITASRSENDETPMPPLPAQGIIRDNHHSTSGEPLRFALRQAQVFASCHPRGEMMATVHRVPATANSNYLAPQSVFGEKTQRRGDDKGAKGPGGPEISLPPDYRPFGGWLDSLQQLIWPKRDWVRPLALSGLMAMSAWPAVAQSFEVPAQSGQPGAAAFQPIYLTAQGKEYNEIQWMPGSEGPKKYIIDISTSFTFAENAERYSTEIMMSTSGNRAITQTITKPAHFSTNLVYVRVMAKDPNNNSPLSDWSNTVPLDLSESVRIKEEKADRNREAMRRYLENMSTKPSEDVQETVIEEAAAKLKDDNLTPERLEKFYYRVAKDYVIRKSIRIQTEEYNKKKAKALGEESTTQPTENVTPTEVPDKSTPETPPTTAPSDETPKITEEAGGPIIIKGPPPELYCVRRIFTDDNMKLKSEDHYLAHPSPITIKAGSSNWISTWIRNNPWNSDGYVEMEFFLVCPGLINGKDYKSSIFRYRVNKSKDNFSITQPEYGYQLSVDPKVVSKGPRSAYLGIRYRITAGNQKMFSEVVSVPIKIIPPGAGEEKSILDEAKEALNLVGEIAKYDGKTAIIGTKLWQRFRAGLQGQRGMLWEIALIFGYKSIPVKISYLEYLYSHRIFQSDQERVTLFGKIAQILRDYASPSAKADDKAIDLLLPECPPVRTVNQPIQESAAHEQSL